MGMIGTGGTNRLYAVTVNIRPNREIGAGETSDIEVPLPESPDLTSSNAEFDEYSGGLTFWAATLAGNQEVEIRMPELPVYVENPAFKKTEQVSPLNCLNAELSEDGSKMVIKDYLIEGKAKAGRLVYTSKYGIVEVLFDLQGAAGNSEQSKQSPLADQYNVDVMIYCFQNQMGIVPKVPKLK